MNEDSKIVVKIAGENGDLKKSLTDANNNIKKFGDEAKNIDKALKFNPENVELLQQKFENLEGQISSTRDKLNSLKSVEEQVLAKLASGEIDSTQYNAFRREIINTEQALNGLIEKQSELSKPAEDIDDTADKVKKIGDNAKASEKQVATLGDLIRSNLISDVIKRGLDEVGGKIGDFVRSGVEMASDLQEVKNVVDTTFGDGASQIYEWAESAETSFGVSSLQAQKYNGTLGAMMKSMGLTDAAILKMSTDMVGLSGDMASFYNLDVEDAFSKIRSGISGETEPLKQLGINMSVANLEAFALANGIETAYDKMSQAEQATLRYNYLMAQTADAQGDFERTSDSFANQQRILQLQMDELSASLGEKLLPYLNDIFSTVNDKLPEAEKTIENIGDLLGIFTSFVIENHREIISATSAYIAFQGALKAGTAISTAVSAVKALTTATEGAAAAQQTMNAVSAANPYVLLASAIAAVTVGIIAYASSVETVDKKLKEIDEDVENIKAKTQEKITSDEAEIEVIKRKADIYETLREKQDRSAGEEERLKELAEELQQYMPEGTSLIDEQTGAYNSLADSIDGVIESMKRKAYIEAFNDEISEIVEKQIEVKKAIADTQKEYDELTDYLNDLGTKAGVDVFLPDGSLNKDALGAFNAFDENGNVNPYAIDTIGGENPFTTWEHLDEEVKKAQAQIDGYEKDIQDIQGLIDDVCEESSGSIEKTGTSYETYSEYMQAMGEAKSKEEADRIQQQVTDYETALQAQIDAHKDSLDLHQIDEEEYQNWLGNYLEKNKNVNSKLYWSMYDDHQEYLDKKKSADEKAAEDAKKAAEKAAEEEQKIAEEANKKAIKEHEDALKEQQKAVDKGLENIIKKYDEMYKELDKLRDKYKSKLMSIGGELFSVEEVENADGSKTKQYIVNNLDEQLAAMRKYHSQVKKLKEQEASNELLSELFSLGDEDSKIFADNLSKMSESEFSKINELYTAKQQLADELAEEMYKSDAEKISAAVEDELENLANKGDTLGKEAAEIYAEAFKNELAEQFDKLEELFGDPEFTASLKAAVESEAAASVPASVWGGTVINNNNVTNQSNSGYSNPKNIDEFFSRFNKPIQIVLDKKVLAESVITYRNDKKRSTGT